MINDKETELLKRFWNNCKIGFAHLTPRKSYPTKFFKKYFNLNNKIILEFGGGGGYLGEFLFRDFNIEKYIDIDISERSLEYARVLLKHKNAFCYLNEGQNFDIYKADFFLCRAVIHHFPNIEYLNDFLDKVNNSKIPDLFLTTKTTRKDIDYTFQKNSYETGKEKIIGNACLVRSSYISKELTNYILQYVRITKKTNERALVYKVNRLTL